VQIIQKVMSRFWWHF